MYSGKCLVNALTDILEGRQNRKRDSKMWYKNNSNNNDTICKCLLLHFRQGQLLKDSLLISMLFESL